MRALAPLTLLSNRPPASVLGTNSARFRGLSRVFVPAPLAMRTVSKPAQHAAAFQHVCDGTDGVKYGLRVAGKDCCTTPHHLPEKHSPQDEPSQMLLRETFPMSLQARNTLHVQQTKLHT